jgi:hypothetical protein
MTGANADHDNLTQAKSQRRIGFCLILEAKLRLKLSKCEEAS